MHHLTPLRLGLRMVLLPVASVCARETRDTQTFRVSRSRIIKKGAVIKNPLAAKSDTLRWLCLRRMT
jgi:hypothetical protein